MHGSQVALGMEPAFYEDPEAENSSVGDHMTSWLELEGQGIPPLTPAQVSDWLRTVPTNKVERETKKDLARRVLHFKLNGDDFQHILASGRWAELGIQTERESVILLRHFKQRQQEATMAEAARQTAKLNMTNPAKKGDFLIA